MIQKPKHSHGITSPCRKRRKRPESRLWGRSFLPYQEHWRGTQKLHYSRNSSGFKADNWLDQRWRIEVHYQGDSPLGVVNSTSLLVMPFGNKCRILKQYDECSKREWLAWRKWRNSQWRSREALCLWITLAWRGDWRADYSGKKVLRGVPIFSASSSSMSWPSFILEVGTLCRTLILSGDTMRTALNIPAIPAFFMYSLFIQHKIFCRWRWSCCWSCCCRWWWSPRIVSLIIILDPSTVAHSFRSHLKASVCFLSNKRLSVMSQ